MGEEDEHTLVDVTGLSKPADTLIKKVSHAVGGIFKPYQIDRVAKAEARAAILEAQTEIEITDLHRRAMYRFIEEEAQHQKNMESITGKAIPYLDDEADAAEVSDDWVTNFFDKSRIISEDEMQNLWARVLAGEVNKPGTFSRRTINILGDLDPNDARLFTNLCGFIWNFGILTPIIFEPSAKIYNDYGINFESLKHLDALGLIQFEALAGYTKQKLPKKFTIFYYGHPLKLELKPDSDKLEIGKVLLTRIGQDLAPISGSKPVPGFIEYITEKWADYLPKSDTEQVGPADPSPSARGG